MKKQVYLMSDLHLKQVYMMFQAVRVDGRRVGEGPLFIWFCGDYPEQCDLNWSQSDPGETEVDRLFRRRGDIYIKRKSVCVTLPVCCQVANSLVLSVVAWWETNQFMPDICDSTFNAVQSRAHGIRYALDTKTLAQFSSRVVLNSGELYSLQMVS